MATDAVSDAAIEIVSAGARDTVFSPDHTKIYVSNSNGTITVFDTATKARLATWNVGTSLGAISISPDGKTLLAIEGSPPDGSSVVYKVDTASGAKSEFSLSGDAFIDAQMQHDGSAILTGGQDVPQKLNLVAGMFSLVEGAVFYSNSSIMVKSNHYTLLGEQGISNGPLFLYDRSTGTVVASGDDYGGASGFNRGVESVNRRVGVVAQLVYYGSINIYDIDLNFIRTIQADRPIDGMSFDRSGRYLFYHLIDTVEIVKIDTTTWAEEGRLYVHQTSYVGSGETGSELAMSKGGRMLSLRDPVSGDVFLVDLSHKFATSTGAGVQAFAQAMAGVDAGRGFTGGPPSMARTREYPLLVAGRHQAPARGRGSGGATPAAGG